MNTYNMLQALFAGMFFANGVPHLVKGITGETHMTPFKRVSSPSLNVVWGFVNFVLGFLILGMNSVTGVVNIPTGTNLWAFVAGAFVLAMTAAWLFSRPNARLPWHKD